MSNPVIRRRSSGHAAVKKPEEEEEEEDIVSERLIEYIVVIGCQEDEENGGGGAAAAAAGKDLGPVRKDEEADLLARLQPESLSLDGADSTPSIQADSSEALPPKLNIVADLSRFSELSIGSPVSLSPKLRTSRLSEDPSLLSVDGPIIQVEAPSVDAAEEDVQEQAVAPELGSPQFMERFGSTFWFEEPVCSVQLVKPTLGEDFSPGYEIVSEISKGFALNLNHEIDKHGHNAPCYLLFMRKKQPQKVTSVVICEISEGKPVDLPQGYEFLDKTVGGNDGTFNLGVEDGRRWGICVKKETLPDEDPNVVTSFFGKVDPYQKDLDGSLAENWGPFCTKITPNGSYASLFLMKTVPSTNYVNEKPPKIISRYPVADHEDFDFPLSMTMFAHPSGSLYRKTPGSIQVLTFILTNNEGGQTFGISLQFYEEVESSDPFPKYQLKSLCLLSNFPFYGSFSQVLVYLLGYTEKPTNIPIERHITNLFEIPPPPKGPIHVLYKIDNYPVYFQRKSAFGLPPLRVPSDLIFRHMSIKNVTLFLSLVLTEQKIILHSNNECLLNPILEQICEVMFPFQWPNIFISVFPAPLVDFLQAFVPFLFGMSTRTYEKFVRDGAVPDEICVVDLNNNEIKVAGSFRMLSVHQIVSERLLSVLVSFTPNKPFHRGHGRGHSRTASAFDFGKIEDLPQLSKENNPVRMTFIDFFVRLMSFYRMYLKMPEGQLSSMLDLFDSEGFIRTKSEISRKFYEDIIQTQLFSQFLEKRTFRSDLDEAFSFLDAKMDRYETKNMQDDASDLSEHKYNELPPENLRVYTVLELNAENLQPLFVDHRRFPKFSEELFIKLRRPAPFNLVSAPKTQPQETREPNTSVSLALDGESPQKAHFQRNSRKSMLLNSKASPFSMANQFKVHTDISQEILLTIYVAWFRLFTAHASKAPQPAACFKQARAVFWYLKNKMDGPFDMVYQHLLEICGKRGLSDEARALFREMTALGIKPRAVSYGWYAQAVSSGGKDFVKPKDAKKTESRLFDQPIEMHDLSMKVVCVCSTCSYSLSETEVLSGWMDSDVDYQVPCTVCGKLSPVYLCFDRIRKASSWHSHLVLPNLKYGEQIYLLKPAHFREELEVQLDSRKGRIWKSKESFLKNQTTLFWNAVWYFANTDLPFERAELNRAVMNYEETLTKGISLVQTNQMTLFQRLRQTMPSRKESKQEVSNKTFVTLNFSVNGLRRNLQGWPSRVHPLQTLYAQLDLRKQEDKNALAALNEIRESVIVDDLQTAIRIFIKSRTKFPNKAPFSVFFQSCYDHIATVAYTLNPHLDELEFSKKYGRLLLSLDPAMIADVKKRDQVPTKEVIAIRTVFQHLRL